MSDAVALELGRSAGESLRVEWRVERLAALDPTAADRDPPWSLRGEPDWTEIETIRILSARLDDGRLAGIVAVRPAGAGGHGDELVAAALGTAEGLGDVEQALLSTEYGPDGLPRRVGVELYREGGGLPVRIAGDAVSAVVNRQGDARRVSAVLELRSSGEAGVGLLDLLSG